MAQSHVSSIGCVFCGTGGGFRPATGGGFRWRGGGGRLPLSVAGWRVGNVAVAGFRCRWRGSGVSGMWRRSFQMRHFRRKCLIWKRRHIPDTPPPRHRHRKPATATLPRLAATASGSPPPPPSTGTATCGGPEAATPPPIPQKTHSKRWLERKYLSTPTGLYYCLRRFGFDFINR